MARMISGVLTQDCRLNREGKIDMGGRLYLRGTTVEVHADYAELVTQPKKPPRRRAKTPPPTRSAAVNTQALPPVTK